MSYKFRQYLEPAIWIALLLVLFFMDTSKESGSFCLFKMLGFSHCPGCGIGHAIHDALHLRFIQSFHEHWLGIPAVLIILYTIIQSLLTLKTPHRYESTKPIHHAAGHTSG